MCAFAAIVRLRHRGTRTRHASVAAGSSFAYRFMRLSAGGRPQVRFLRERALGIVLRSRLDGKCLKAVTSRTFCTMLGV